MADAANNPHGKGEESQILVCILLCTKPSLLAQHRCHSTHIQDQFSLFGGAHCPEGAQCNRRNAKCCILIPTTIQVKCPTQSSDKKLSFTLATERTRKPHPIVGSDTCPQLGFRIPAIEMRSPGICSLLP